MGANRGWGARRIAAAWLGALAVAGLPARAAPPPRAPGRAQAIRATVQPQQSLEMSCTVDDAEPTSSSFIASTYSDGDRRASTFAVLKGNRAVYADAGAGPARFVVEPSDDTPLGYRSTIVVFLLTPLGDGPYDVVIAWASWGESLSCTAELDGAVLPAADLSPHDATSAAPGDLSGIAASLAAGIGLGEAGAGGALAWRAHGTLLALMRFAPGVAAGAFRATGPEGQRYEATGLGPTIAIAEPTSGEWTFAVDAGAAATAEGSILWAIAVPD